MRAIGPCRPLLVLALGLVVGCGDGHPTVAPDELNVLLITIDTLRVDHISSYDYDRETSPSLDRIAREGVLFRNAIVQRGGTWPSLTSILTSMHPRTHGVRNNGELLAASIPTIAERLQGRGFATAAMITNMGSAPHRGFATKGVFTKSKDEDHDVQATQAARRWLEKPRAERFFLWVHLIGPHDPYVPRRDFFRGFDTGYTGRLDGRRPTLDRIFRKRRELTQAELAHIVSLYDAEIAQVDARIGEIVESVDRLGLASSTLVIVTSDHGEELYDHNHYFFHSSSIYDSLLRVPLIMRLPGTLPEGAVVDAVVQSIDIAPTIFDLLGLPPADGFEGTSLVGRMRAPTGGGEDAGVAFSELNPDVFSIRTDRWHFIQTRHGDAVEVGGFRIEGEELYDVRHDPGETRNVVRERNDVAAGLRDRPGAWIAADAGTYRPQALRPEVEAELRALGYVE